MSRLAAVPVGDYGIAWRDLISTAPSYALLSADYFSDPARLVRDSLVVHREGQPLFVLPLARDGGRWVSHPEAFAAALIPLGTASPDDLSASVAAVASAGAGSRLTLRLRPTTVDPVFAERESGAWRMQPSSVIRSVAVLAVDLHSTPPLSSRRRRAMSKAVRNGLVVRPVAHDDELRAGWRCIQDVYTRRGLTGLLPIERVRTLLALPAGVASVHVAEVEGRVVGAALGYQFGKAYRLPVYGMLDEPDAAGGTESVISAMVDRARTAGCDFLDLGTSSDPGTGRTVSGIAQFKVEMGARPWPVEHLEVHLTTE